jgi:hypothetical protein
MLDKRLGPGVTDRRDRDAELLRTIKTLENINDNPAAYFWMKVDGKVSRFCRRFGLFSPAPSSKAPSHF